MPTSRSVAGRLPLPSPVRHVGSGKVRELYDAGDDRLVLVASDRISAFDVVMPTPIPDKGRVLTGLSLFWFERTADVVPNHLLSPRLEDLPAELRDPALAGRTMLCRRLEMLPIECVVRGYLAGSGWKDYRATRALCGHELPAGLVEADRLPQPIFTPATKAEAGDHDENITADAARQLVGEERYAEVERIALELYARAAAWAEQRGVILADTKFEFGLDADGRLVLGDEAFTPDSSRFWPADAYRPGASPPSYDKQFVRDWLETLDWDKRPPGPELPPEVVEGTARRYREAYSVVTGRAFATYLDEMGVT
jgi:phosphoribosylaminoimidazole-succinocarboxamide synthase